MSTATVKLVDLSTGKKVALASVTASGVVVTITPAAALHARHRFQVTVLSGAAGLHFTDGRILGKAIKVSFKTG